jgi:hypothetical protein
MATATRIAGRQHTPSRVDGWLITGFIGVVRKHAKRRLQTIVKWTEMLFQLCSQGKLEVIGVNAYGSFIWGPPLAERIADGDPRGENRRRLIKLARSIQANRVQQKMNTKSRIIR